jgi:Cdc6-like AAA superfamily ATPase
LSAPEPETKSYRLAKAGQVFTPAAPIDQFRLFSGRVRQAREVVSAVSQRGLHVVLYGERGVGKTSLANILAELLGDLGVQGLKSGTINCDSSDDYVSIWRKVLRELTVYRELPRGAGFMPQLPGLEESSLEPLAAGDLTPDDVRYILDQIPQRVVIVIDELNRVTDKNALALLSDTIKTLSDHSVEVTIVLVGVADSVDELIGEHPSVERAIRQVPMPRMSQQELFEIVDKGLNELALTIEPAARDRIARLSEGLPAFTHMLCLEASQLAVTDDRTEINSGDVDVAVRGVVDNIQQSIRSAYHLATSSPRKDNLFGRVLLACALAPTDFLGYFAAADVRKPMSRIMGKRYEIQAFSQHLKDFVEESHGPVLQRIGQPRKYRYRFIRPMLGPYAIMHGLATGLITEDLVQELQAEQNDHSASGYL